MNKWYKDINGFESGKRIHELILMGDSVNEYFEIHEGEDQQKVTVLRRNINRTMERCRKYVLYAGISPEVHYTSPPIVGGSEHRVDVIRNIFLLESLQIPPNVLFDQLNQAIGVYEDDKVRAWIRTFNPFWWFMILIKFFISIPIIFLKWLGFNGSKIEKSFWGKLLKIIWTLVGVPATIDALMSLLGYPGLIGGVLQTWKQLLF